MVVDIEQPRSLSPPQRRIEQTRIGSFLNGHLGTSLSGIKTSMSLCDSGCLQVKIAFTADVRLPRSRITHTNSPPPSSSRTCILEQTNNLTACRRLWNKE